MLNQYVKIRAKDYSRSLYVLGISAAIIIPLGIIFVIIPFFLVVSLGFSVWVLLISAFIFVSIILLGLFGCLFVSLSRRKSNLDSCCIPLGLKGSSFVLTGRQYNGDIHGRETRIRVYRGPTFEIRMGVNCNLVLTLIKKGAPFLAKTKPVDSGAINPNLTGFNVFSMHSEGARLFLNHNEVVSVLSSLMNAGNSWALVWQLFIDNNQIIFRLYRNKNRFKYKITPEEVQAWVNGLNSLAQVVESAKL